MTSSNYDFIVRFLNSNISVRLLNIPSDIKNNIQEIRFRVNRPVTLSCKNEVYYITNKGCISNTPLNEGMVILDKKEITEIFNNLCCYSVYSKQNEIINGFITVKGGNRAGICGTAVMEKEEIVNIRNISSINIRIAKEFKDCSQRILDNTRAITEGLLICGAPCSGKTTVLRDLARVLSTKYNKKVSVIDSRGEIAATYKGVPQMDIGMCDILDGYSKKDGFSHAIRCLSSDIIICDELGSQEDIFSVEKAVNSGVSIIASAHCSNKKELLNKPNLLKLIKSQGFKTVVFLANKENVGQISQVLKANELYS